MPSIQKLSDIKRTVSIPWGEDEVINVTYRLAAINAGLFEWVDENGSDRGSLFMWFEKVGASWDVTDNGEQIPLTRESMQHYEVATALLRIMQEKIYADSNTSNLSKAFGTRSLVSDASRSGTPS